MKRSAGLVRSALSLFLLCSCDREGDAVRATVFAGHEAPELVAISGGRIGFDGTRECWIYDPPRPFPGDDTPRADEIVPCEEIERMTARAAGKGEG